MEATINVPLRRTVVKNAYSTSYFYILKTPNDILVLEAARRNGKAQEELSPLTFHYHANNEVDWGQSIKQSVNQIFNHVTPRSSYVLVNVYV